MKIHYLALAIAAGCGAHNPGPSQELLQARSEYARAEHSTAIVDAPNSLERARVTLSAAEEAYQDDPGSQQERELAYMAIRRAQAAIADGNARAAQRDAEAAQELLRRRTAEAARALDRAKAQADAARAQADAATRQAQHEELQRRVSDEERELAERERDQAIEAMRELGKVAKQDRSLVLTMPAEVMFADDSATLLPTAKDKLDQLAKTLQELGTEQSFVIEGHTDSRGSDAYNHKLSQLRAMAVRGYLIDRGVDPDRITAIGRGEDVPIASNTAPEGRANNRRVEIVVNPPAVSRR